MRKARDTVDKILRNYPDYGKAPPSYVTALIEVVTHYGPDFHEAFADLKTGVSSRTAFLPTPFHFAEVAKEHQVEINRMRRLDEMDVRFKRAILEAPEGPYKPVQPARYYDRRGDEITPRQARERMEQHARDVASMAKVDRMTAFVRELGQGDSLKGWEIVVERGLSEPPAEWTPLTPHTTQDKAA